jgi:peptidoglycan/xylan/chitin deacetylase (PgdA/CDA1 family)
VISAFYNLFRHFVFHISKRVRCRRYVSILMVHGVTDDDINADWVPLRPRLGIRRLEDYLLMLSRHYQFVSLHDAVDMISAKAPISPFPLVITFDDGYRNNVQLALPVLKRFNITPTIFLATGHNSRRKPFWFDRLDYALQHSDVAGRTFSVGGKSIVFRSNHRSHLSQGYKSLRSAAKGVMRPDLEMVRELEELVDRLENESGRGLSDIFEKDFWASVLSWDEIKEAANHGVSFGSHTVDHVRLALVDDVSVRYQLSESKKVVEKYTGRPCFNLCYPSGSFDQRIMKIAGETGYRAAVTTLPGLNRTGDDPMSLRRINFPEQEPIGDLLGNLAGWGGFNSMLKVPKDLFLEKQAFQENILGD